MTTRRVLVGLVALITLFAGSCSSGDTVATDVSSGSADAGSSETVASDDASSGAADTTADSGSADASASDGAMKVGFITTLSGGAAYIGEDLRDGMQLALDLDNSHPIEIIAVDDGQDPELGLQAAERLLDQENVDLMTGVIFSNIALAIVPEVVERDMIYISPNAGPSVLAGPECHENYFNTAFQNDGFR